ncbi:MAG: substrate-binding domain-containing protein [Blautia sp.]
MRRKALAIMLVVFTGILCTACAGTDKTEEEEKTAEADTEEISQEKEPEEIREMVIGVSAPDHATDTWAGDMESLRVKLEEVGWKTQVELSKDGKAQADQIAEMADKVSALIVIPPEPEAVSNALDAYEQSDIPVISYGSLVPDTDGVDFYVGFDSESAGEETGAYIEKTKGLKDAKDAGEVYTVEFLLDDAQNLDTQFFYEGVMSVLKPYFDQGTLKSNSGRERFTDVCLNTDDSLAYRDKTEEILSQFYGEEPVDIICTQKDLITDAVVEILAQKEYALDSQRWPWPVLTGQDATQKAVRRILSGRQGITISREYELLDESCVDILKKVLEGEDVKVNTRGKYDNGSKIVPAQLSDVQLIDLDNYKILADMGIYTEEELEKLKSEEK